jgi:hypothetical protein
MVCTCGMCVWSVCVSICICGFVLILSKCGAGPRSNSAFHEGLSWPIVPEITHNNGCKMGAKDAKKVSPGPVPTGPGWSLENGGHGRTMDQEWLTKPVTETDGSIRPVTVWSGPQSISSSWD